MAFSVPSKDVLQSHGHTRNEIIEDKQKPGNISALGILYEPVHEISVLIAYTRKCL